MASFTRFDAWGVPRCLKVKGIENLIGFALAGRYSHESRLGRSFGDNSTLG